MTLAWSAALIAQAALAMRLPPGALRQFHAWQVAGGLAVFAVRQTDGPYRWCLAAFWLVDAAMLIRAVQRVAPRLWLGMSSVSIAATVAWQARAWSALSVPGLLAMLPHAATAYGLCFARGWLLAFLLLRWAVLLIGWHHGLTPIIWQAHQWVQAGLFLAWAAKYKSPEVNPSGLRQA